MPTITEDVKALRRGITINQACLEPKGIAAAVNWFMDVSPDRITRLLDALEEMQAVLASREGAEAAHKLSFVIEEVPRTNRREGTFWRIRWPGGGTRPASGPEKELWQAIHALGVIGEARKPLTEDEIERGRKATFSTGNPFCPCDSKTMRKAVRWAERVHGIHQEPTHD